MSERRELFGSNRLSQPVRTNGLNLDLAQSAFRRMSSKVAWERRATDYSAKKMGTTDMPSTCVTGAFEIMRYAKSCPLFPLDYQPSMLHILPRDLSELRLNLLLR